MLGGNLVNRNMPTRCATVTIDAATVSPSKALAATARLAPLVVVTDRCFGEMLAELGGAVAASAHLVRVATNVGKPLAVNLPRGLDRSTTVFIGPKGWSDERVAGWIGGHHETLERQFGPATLARREGP